MNSIDEILKDLACYDFLDMHEDEIVFLTDKTKSSLLQAVLECVGEDETEQVKPMYYFGETVDSMLAAAHKRMERNKEKAEIRERLKKLFEGK